MRALRHKKFILSAVLLLSVSFGVWYSTTPDTVKRDTSVTDRVDRDNRVDADRLYEADYKDKQGKVVVRVLGKTQKEADLLLEKTLKARRERDRRIEEEYQKSVEASKRRIDLKEGTDRTEGTIYESLDREIVRVFGLRIGSDKKEFGRVLKGYDSYGKGNRYLKYVGSFRVYVSVVMGRDDLVESYSVRVEGDDASVLRHSSSRARELLARMEDRDNESVAVSVKNLEKQHAYSLFKSGRSDRR